MTPFEHQMICQTACNDIRHANSIKYELQNAASRLSKYNDSHINIDYHNPDINSIRQDCTHLHFMCGQCIKFDMREIHTLDHQIQQAAICLYIKICDNELSPAEYYDAMSTLHHYNIIYHVLDRTWQKYNRK